jgi:hypothetical protein
MSTYRLRNLFSPRSVALVGASPRQGSVGHPRPMRRRRAGVPAIAIYAAVGDHFEVLGLTLRRRIRIGLVESVGHADAFDRLLLDAVDRLRRLDAGGFKDGRRDIDDVVELVADAAGIIDVAGPRDREALPGAAVCPCFR